MRTKIYLDSEFTQLRKDSTLISIGFISECGEKKFYAEFTDYNKDLVDDWIEKNVIENLRLTHRIPKTCSSWESWLSDSNEYENSLEFVLAEKDMSRFECAGETPMIKNRLERWFSQFDEVEIWSDCLSYDWVLFCDIFGGAFSIPKNIYYIPFDICTTFKEKGIDPDVNREEFSGLDTKDAVKHNALWDAKVIRSCHQKLEKI